MANIESSIRAKLLVDGTITGLIGTRLYYQRAVQTTIYPYVVYTLPSNEDARVEIGTDGSNPVFSFKIIAKTLLHGDTLDELHRDHKLIGSYAGRRECHIESDWLLIYKLLDDQIIFERMGNRSDLFKK